MTEQITILPQPVVQLLRTSVMCEFATVSFAGVPIDTPMNYFSDETLSSLDVATGLAYPSKAQRARKNPKVGLLVEGAPGEPIVAIAGRAAVRDTDLQANADRYMAETAFNRVTGAPWPLARKAVWYWTRIFICIAPARILWWDNAAAMDRPAQEWRAPPGTVFPASDPEPPGKVSVSPNWPDQESWRDQARFRLASALPAHLTLCDADGYPLPIRVGNPRLVEDGFTFTVPKGAPWAVAGKATLTFAGLSTFVGTVTTEGDHIHLSVERALPVFPLVADESYVWEPPAAVLKTIMARLDHEASRRGRPLPTIPNDEPQPSPTAKARMARIAAGKEPARGAHVEEARAVAASMKQGG